MERWYMDETIKLLRSINASLLTIVADQKQTNLKLDELKRDIKEIKQKQE